MNRFFKALGFSGGASQPEPSNAANPEPAKTPKKGGKLNQSLKSNRSYYVDLALDSWKTATEAAEWSENPDFTLYYGIIREVLKRDGRLRSQIKQAVNKVLDEPWAIVDIKTKEIDKEATELMSSKFFYDLLKIKVEAELYGVRVAELGQPVLKEMGWEFGPCFIINQENLNPKTGRLFLNFSDSTGVPYREAPFNTYLIEAGDPEDLGLFVVATYLSIMKKFSLLDWSKSGEKFMDPVLVIKTDTDNETELQNKERYAQNFGNNSYAILDKEDEIDLLERTSQTGYQLVKDLALFLNTEMAEAMNGQSATTEQKSFVGSAQVQERVAESFATARMREASFWVNDVVFPKIMTVDNGAFAYSEKLKGKKFMFLQMMKELKDPNLEEPGLDPNTGQPLDPSRTPPKPGAKKKPGQPSNQKRFDPITNQFG